MNKIYMHLPHPKKKLKLNKIQKIRILNPNRNVGQFFVVCIYFDYLLKVILDDA